MRNTGFQILTLKNFTTETQRTRRGEFVFLSVGGYRQTKNSCRKAAEFFSPIGISRLEKKLALLCVLCASVVKRGSFTLYNATFHFFRKCAKVSNQLSGNHGEEIWTVGEDQSKTEVDRSGENLSGRRLCSRNVVQGCMKVRCEYEKSCCISRYI